MRSWRLSSTLDAGFCVEALEEALRKGKPEIFNTDQGIQFTRETFTSFLESHGVTISMDGKGDYNNNLSIGRLWQSARYPDGRKAKTCLGNDFRFYNTERPHQA
jgi:putative transposase